MSPSSSRIGCTTGGVVGVLPTQLNLAVSLRKFMEGNCCSRYLEALRFLVDHGCSRVYRNKAGDPLWGP